MSTRRSVERRYEKKNPMGFMDWLQAIIAVGTLGYGGYELYSYFKFGGNAKWAPLQFALPASATPRAAQTPTVNMYALLEDIESGAAIIVQVTGTGTLDNLPASTGTVQQVIQLSAISATNPPSKIAIGDLVAFHDQDILRVGATVAALVADLSVGLAALLASTGSANSTGATPPALPASTAPVPPTSAHAGNLSMVRARR